MGFDALDRRALDEAAEARRAAISLAFLPQTQAFFGTSAPLALQSASEVIQFPGIGDWSLLLTSVWGRVFPACSITRVKRTIREMWRAMQPRFLLNPSHFGRTARIPFGL
jgi:hypothetical protein